MKAIFNQMETEDEQCSVDRNCVEIQKKELLIENDRLLEKIILQDIMYTAMHADVENKCVLPNDETLKYAEIKQSYIDEYNRCVELEDWLSTKKDMVEKIVYNELSNRFAGLKNVDAPEFLAFFEINDLKAQLQAKNTSINKLKEHIATLKGKSVSDCTVPINNSNVIALGMYKLDWHPLSPKLRKNREAHVDYLKKIMEHADTLRDILEQARALKPLDNSLDYACKFSTRIHEFLFYVSAACPSSRNESEKLVSVTPVNKKKQVMFEEPSTSTSNIQKQVVQIVLWYLDSGFSKHMTRQRSQLINFVRKFMVTVRFGNDQVAAIMGYGDYQIGNTLRSYYEDVRISHQTSVVRTPQQYSIVERQNQTLVKAACTMLIFSKAPLILKLDLKYLHVFGPLCYPTNDSEDMGKLKPKADIALMQNLSSSTPYVPPTKKDLDILFQPMFDEYFQPFSSVVSCVLPNVALIPSDPTGTPSSTTLDQDAPYASTSLTTHETQSLVIHPGVEE
ncbi:retrovirus-related pol polyprotein from transposon TNT 1-94 [Tanacetum coccineum]